MSPYLIAAMILAAIVLTMISMKLLAGRPTPAIVASVEDKIAEDGWKLLAKTMAAVADGTAKKQAVSNASADLAEHFQNVAKLKAAAAALPDA